MISYARFLLIGSLCLVFCKNFVANAQNLVPNGSFEDKVSCPTYEGSFQSNVTDWIQINTVDYFNTCGSNGFNMPFTLHGYQDAYEGDAFAGIKTYSAVSYREFIMVRLTENLQAGTAYCLSFYINHADSSFWSIDALGANFSVAPLEDINLDTFVPSITCKADYLFEDTTTWVITGERYVATGGERYLTIGNFLNDERTTAEPTNIHGFEGTAYYYIDNVSLYENDQIVVNVSISETDTLEICEGSSLILQPDNFDYKTYLWQDGSSGGSLTVTEAGTYKLTVEDVCHNKASDEVVVVSRDCSKGCLLFPNTFTPNGDGMNDVFRALGDCPVENFQLKVFNRWGDIVFEANDKDTAWDGTFDGKLTPISTYVWLANYFDVDHNLAITVGGPITILR